MSKCTSFMQRYYSCRWRLCYASAILFLLSQTLRVALSMAFVCMLKTPNRTSEEHNVTINNQQCSSLNTSSVIHNSKGEFEWSDNLQANILAGYYYGFVATNFLGGLLADKYGGKRVLGGSLFFTSILAILHPSLARISGYCMLVLRILTGMASGVVPPAIHSSFARWIPPQEIGSSIGFTFAGQLVGNVICLSVSGFLCVYGFDNGWGSIFYIFGGISLVFSCVWFYIVYDNPDVHPTISEEERSYLKRSIVSKNLVQKIPWKRLLSSPAIWAIIFGSMAYVWTFITFETLLPLYIKEALNVKTTSNGFMSSAPSVGQIISMPLCGKLADFIRSKKYLSTRSVRVLFQTFSLLTSACILIVIGFLRCNQIVLITILLFLSGITISFTSGGSCVNNNDIAPSYAGLLFGFSNTFAVTAGSICSLTTKALTPNGTQEEWQIVLILCAGICVLGAIFYAILAKGEIQEWATSEGSSSSDYSNTTTI